MKHESLPMIEALSNAPGAPGFEDEVVRVAREYAQPWAGKLEEDHLRNLYIHRKENTGDKPVMLLDAHTDEVALIVEAIRPDGTLSIFNLGGLRPNIALYQKVRVLNKDGKYIPGIVVTKPVFYQTEQEKQGTGSYDTVGIDVGACSKEELIRDFGIRPGAPVVPDVKLEYIENKGLCLGKAFDDRIGCAFIMDAMRRLEGKDLNIDVVGVLSSQEEIGLRGIKIAVNRVKPNIAIICEGCAADDTFLPTWKIQAGIGRGPMLRHMDKTIICSPRFMRFCLDLGEKLGIPVQEAVRSGAGNNGTHTNLYGDEGVPTVVLSVPVRYSHTPHCFMSMDDYEKTVQLLVAILENLDADTIAGF